MGQGHYRITREIERELTVTCTECGWTKALHGFYVWEGYAVHEFATAPRQTFIQRVRSRLRLA